MASKSYLDKSLEEYKKEWKTWALSSDLPKTLTAEVIDIQEGTDKQGRKALFIIYQTEYGRVKMKYLKTHVSMLIDYLAGLGVNSLREVIGKKVQLTQLTIGNSTRHYITKIL